MTVVVGTAPECPSWFPVLPSDSRRGCDMANPDGTWAEARQAREDIRHQLAKIQHVAALERSTSLERMSSRAPLGAARRLVRAGGRGSARDRGTKRTAIGRILMGSLARAIIEVSRFPVLVVPVRDL